MLSSHNGINNLLVLRPTKRLAHSRVEHKTKLGELVAAHLPSRRVRRLGVRSDSCLRLPSDAHAFKMSALSATP
jgi:hypothetical protein